MTRKNLVAYLCMAPFMLFLGVFVAFLAWAAWVTSTWRECLGVFGLIGAAALFAHGACRLE